MRASTHPVALHHRRLLAAVALVIAGLDFVAAVQNGLFAPGRLARVVPCALFSATAAALVAFVLNRRGATRAALAIVVGTQIVVSPIITMLMGAHDDASVLTLGMWLAPPILIASAIVSHRVILAVGAAAALILGAVLGVVHGFGASTSFQALIFVATLTSLLAVATRHRDRLDLIHQADLRASNSELQQLRDSLEQRVDERTKALLVAEKMAAIGRLTAGIAHEMSSPLAAVLGALEDIERLIAEYQQSIGHASVEPEDHRAIAREMLESLGTAKRAADRSAVFVKSIKAQTRVSAAGKSERFDAAVLVRDCAQLLAHAARSSRCNVTLTAADGIEVYGSPSRLGQAVTNLLQNAIDATGEKGGGAVRVEVARSGEATLVIRVSDEGDGIPGDVLPHIFEPLFTTKPYGRGTGLGLAIVKEAVEQELGGRVLVQTTAGQGSAFAIELPLGGQEVNRAA